MRGAEGRGPNVLYRHLKLCVLLLQQGISASEFRTDQMKS
jgi:hypothetical protein